MEKSHKEPKTPENEQDEHRLTLGLNTTSITSLWLSNHLRNLWKAQIPSLKKLTLEYIGLGQLGTPSSHCFPNVETLSVQHTKLESVILPEVGRAYSRLVTPLLIALPKLRVVGFPSGWATLWETRDAHLNVEEIILRHGDDDTALFCLDYIESMPTRSVLQRIVMHQSEDTLDVSFWDQMGFAGLASMDGVEMMVTREAVVLKFSK